MSVDAEKAIAHMRGLSNLIHGRCLMYVWQAYDHAGADTTRTAGTALDAWHKSEGKHPGDRNPPRGVPVWFGEQPSGDVVISLGNGRVIATDQPRYGVIGECTIAERESLAGGPYLGWTSHIFDAPITLPEPAVKEGEDMIINIKGIKGKRRGGLYYVSGGKATFIGGRTWLKQGRYPMFTSEKEIARLQSRITGLR